ncbi:hypothetical protein C7999DRAFT_42523 [Corynascus novoguineensis]|uniref:MARVEL domain-containing protein n=1 Tax=Corynascus novoguineensis TaxID=1126955 RepID=A0AAN7HHQ9_9PEZI|nr:hypothetical protein C7999DRAFT_42523 [Corynascus novoguineensis]
MGAASRVTLVAVRVWQIICAVVVLAILARFVHSVADAGVASDGRIIYGIVVASLTILFSIIFVAPFMYSFRAFPADLALFVMWLVLFSLLATRTGTHTCSSRWFTNYWGYYWGGWWWRRPFIGSPVRFVRSGCGSWRTVLAFSFMAIVAFLISGILTSQIGGPMYNGGAPGNYPSGPAPAVAPGANTTAQPGTYV